MNIPNGSTGSALGKNARDSITPRRTHTVFLSDCVDLHCIVEGSDEGIGGMSAGESEEQSMEELKAEVINLRVQLDRERRLRIALEERNRDLEARLYPSKMAHHVQAQIRYQDHMPQVKIFCSTDCY